MRSLLVILVAYCTMCLVCIYIIMPDKLRRMEPVTERPPVERTANQTWPYDHTLSAITELPRENDTPAMLERERLYLKFLDDARAIDESLRDQPKTKRFPDVINIGVEKCGTGFLREILRRHPKFRFPHKAELQFFTYGWGSGVNFYKNLMPESSPYHVVIEKTPSYFNFVTKTVPERMHMVVPNATIIVVLCDPVNRTFSDFFHEIIMGNLPKGTDFNLYMPRLIAVNKQIQAYQGSDEMVVDFIFRRLSGNTPYHLISTGLYYYHMIRWLKLYRRDQIYVIDGEELITDPGKVAEDLQDYLRVPRLIIKEDFERGPNGFYCIHTPKVQEHMGKKRVVQEELDCLQKKFKGRTRLGGTAYKPSEKIISMLRDFYRPENEKLYRLLGHRFPWD